MSLINTFYLMTGRIECTYEPAMTKVFLHGRTEAIRTVQSESIHFVKASFLLFNTPPLSHCLTSMCRVLLVDVLLRGVTARKGRRSPARM